MDKKEMYEQFSEFISNQGLWYEFIQHLTDQGYKPKEFGFDEDGEWVED